MSRFRAAWGVLTGRLVAVPPPSPADPPAAGPAPVLAWPYGTGADYPMCTAVGLITEAMHGGRAEVLNALLVDVPRDRLPLVTVAAVELASILGGELAELDSTAAAAVLQRVGLHVADRPEVA